MGTRLQTHMLLTDKFLYNVHSFCCLLRATKDAIFKNSSMSSYLYGVHTLLELDVRSVWYNKFPFFSCPWVCGYALPTAHWLVVS